MKIARSRIALLGALATVAAGFLLVVARIGATSREVEIGFAGLVGGGCLGRLTTLIDWTAVVPTPRYRRAFATLFALIGAAFVLSVAAMPASDRVGLVGVILGLLVALGVSGAFDRITIR